MEAMSIDFFIEQAKRLSVAGKADVVVAGCGPAGVAAAVTAARLGCSVIVLESSSMPGGIMTSGLMSNVIDAAGKGGFLQEMLDYLEAQGAGGDYNSYEPEVVKHFFDLVLTQNKIRIRYNTLVVSVIKDADRISAVVTESPSGREAFVGEVYVDCTGNGTLAYHAGCDYEYGAPENGAPQAASLCAVCCGVSADRIPDYCKQAGDIGKLTLLHQLEKFGCSPSYRMPTLFRVKDDEYLLMSNHEYNIHPDDADAISAALTHARLEIFKQIETLKKNVPEFGGLCLVTTASALGLREGRRIRTRYWLTADDLRAGRCHDDAICRVNVAVDIHRSVKNRQSGYDNGGIISKPYDIPLRSLQPLQCSNLLLGGRCIGGDFYAHSTYRVLGNAIPTGEAAGKAAAAAAKMKKTASQITFDDFCGVQ